VTPTAPAPRKRRRVAKVALLLLLCYGSACAFGMHPSLPFDVAINLGSFSRDPTLLVPAEPQRLCVLQHGLWRSPWALWKLERALRAHGYEVFNPGYPSTRQTIGEHAARLHAAIEARLATPPPQGVELLFVGHSMGGLVIHEYLRGAAARTPVACVYLGTPHRGASLCDLRKRWWLFKLTMGCKASLQLSPGDALHQQPIPMPCPIGTIVGAVGDGIGRNASIDGDDDGTVAAREAHCPGEADSVELPVGHTGMATDDRVIAQVLHFLLHRRFARP
jgi:triacylglycerol lipase